MDAGTKFGDWTVIDRDGRWRRCRCICGTIKSVAPYDLREGKSKSCGCTGRITTGKLASIRNRRHGMDGTPIYRTWVDMRRRCYNPSRPDYVNYGGRGVTVCDRWRTSFENFYADMGDRPERHTLDRIDNLGPYSPENCRWAPKLAQERNKRANRWVTADGLRMTVAEASERYGISGCTIIGRLRRGWDEQRSVLTPPLPNHAAGTERARRSNVWINYNGNRLILSAALAEIGSSSGRFYRIKHKLALSHQEAFDFIASQLPSTSHTPISL